ncbi:Bardet-Biedl syndrome 4 -like protein [Halotydeus destructor]|nr:Bardet-Biedl syndrome 4 -like protein [Halotydeus destructor]
MDQADQGSAKPSSGQWKEFKPIESLNWLYHLHYVRSEFEICEKQMDRFKPESEYAMYLKGLIQLRNGGNVRGALDCFSQTKSLANPVYIKAIVRCLVLLGRHQSVCDLVRETALTQAPSDWQLWHMLGLAHYHLGNVPLAKDAFQHSLQTTNRSDPFVQLSLCHIAENDFKSAIFVLRRASEISPEDTNLTISMAILLSGQGLVSKGVDKIMSLQHVSANTSGDLALSLAVGSVMQEVKMDIDSALYRYKMAAIFESPALWNNIALCFAMRKKYVAAVSCLKRALYLNAFDWRMNYNLGLLNLQLRQFASAFHYLKTAATMSQGDGNVFSLLAICLENLDDDLNARQAHISSAKSSVGKQNLTPIINYATYLFNKDKDEFKEVIRELILEYEQIWLKRKQSNVETDVETMKAATRLANGLNMGSQVAWRKSDPVATSSTDGQATVSDNSKTNANLNS